MKNKIINALLFIISIILIILILLGIKSYSASSGITGLKINGTDIDSDMALAGYASNNPNKILEADPKDLIDQTLWAGSTFTNYKTPAIRTKSGACLAHWVGNNTNNPVKYTILDIIDINDSDKPHGYVEITNSYTNGTMGIQYTGDNAKSVERLAYALDFRYRVDENITKQPLLGVSRLAINKIFYNEFYNLGVMKNVAEFDDYIQNVSKNKVNNYYGDYSAENNRKRQTYGESIETNASAHANNVINYRKVEFDDNKSEIVPNVYNGNTYIGPIYIDYGGIGVYNFTVECSDNTRISSTTWASKSGDRYIEHKIPSSSEPLNTNDTNNVPRNQAFYIKISGEHTNIKNIQVGQYQVPKYICRMILLGVKEDEAQQIVIFVTRKEQNVNYDSIQPTNGSLKIKKVDADSSANLSAGFIIYYKEGNTKKYIVKETNGTISDTTIEKDATTFYTSSKNGTVTIKELPAKEYYIKEVKAPDGYDIDLQIVKEQGPKKVEINKVTEVEFTNRKYGNLEIIKVDKENDNPIEDIGFRLRGPEGYLVVKDSKVLLEGKNAVKGTINSLELEEFIYNGEENEATIFLTDANGKITLKNIKLGDYTYIEDLNTMKALGYGNAKGEEKPEEGTISVIANNSNIASLYSSVVRNIFRSGLIKKHIVNSEWTDVDLISKFYKALTSQDYNVSKNYDLLVDSIMGEINYTNSLSGEARYDTTANAAKALYPDGSKVKNLIITYGGDKTTDEKYSTGADALSAVPLASILEAPILIVNENTTNIENMPLATRDEINRYTNLEKVYIIGGSGVIPESLENVLKTKYGQGNVTRIFGTDKYSTSTELANTILGLKSDIDEVIIVESEDYKKGLIDGALISGIASSEQIPIIYVPTDANSAKVTDANKWIKDKGINTAYFIGDAHALMGKFNVANKIDIHGTDRYDTNMEITKYFYLNTDNSVKNGINKVVVFKNPVALNTENNTYTNSEIFIDIITASQLARNGDTLLLMVPPLNYENEFIKGEEDQQRFSKVKDLIKKISQRIIKDGKVYTICEYLLDEDINKMIKNEKYSNYTAKPLSELIHGNCCLATEGSETGYCYKEYTELVRKEIIKVNRSSIEERMQQGENETDVAYAQRMNKAVIDIHKLILGLDEDEEFDESFKISNINYYTSQLLGSSARVVSNKYYGGELTIYKKDAFDTEKPLSAGFVMYIIDANGKKQYLQINNNNPTKGNTITSDGINKIAVNKLEYVSEENENAIDLATKLWTSSDNGKLELTRLKEGTYYVVETNTPGTAYELKMQDNTPAKVEIEGGKDYELPETNIASVNLILTKVEKNNNSKKLENVEFKVRGEKGYIVIKDTRLLIKDKNAFKGIITINDPDQISYSGTENEATTFITNSAGQTGINNLLAGKYTITETKNDNYGFILHDDYVTWSDNDNKTDLGKGVSKEITIAPADVNTIVTKNITIENEPLVRDINLIKKDENGQPMGGMAFTLERKTISEYKYVQVLKDNTKVDDIDIVEIGKDGYTIKEVEQKEDATIFITSNEEETKGKIAIKNLEVYALNSKNEKIEYTYKITEIGDTNRDRSGYVVEDDADQFITWQVGDRTVKDASCEINLTERDITATVINKPKYVKLQGYVWKELDTVNKEGSTGKIFNDETDIKVAGIIVKLYDRQNGNGPIAYAKTNDNGEYTFKFKTDENRIETTDYAVERARLGDYYITFTYDGLYYEAVPRLSQDDIKIKDEDKKEEIVNRSSKAVDVGRTELNNRFEEVTKGEVVRKVNGDTIKTDLTYNYNENEKTAEYNNDWVIDSTRTDILKYQMQGTKFAITATTDGEFDLSKAEINVDTISNINFGIVIKEQPNLSIEEDLSHSKVSVNGLTHTYIYNPNVKTIEESDVLTSLNDDGSYILGIHPTDITEYEGDDKNKLQVDLYYKVILSNTGNFKAKVNSIINYQESFCEYIECLDANKNELKASASDPQVVPNTTYASRIITFDTAREIKSQGEEYIYIHYKISTDNICAAVENDVTLKNVSEIYSYTSYIDEDMNNLYAGIDSNSAPGDYILNPTDGKHNDEDDDNSANSLKIIYTEEPRVISGTVWLDKKTGETGIGDGIYDESNENSGLQYVLVELYDVNLGRTVATTKTDNKGYYEFKDIIPSVYQLKYTYGTFTAKENGEDKKFTTIIVDEKGNTQVLNVRNYKSTILNNTSNSFKVLNSIKSDDLEENKYWVYNETSRFNDAIDNWETRGYIDNETSMTWKTVNKELSIDASTAIFEAGVELTDSNETKADYDKQKGDIKHYTSIKNIDFGVIERPKQNATISKEITDIKIILMNGQIVIEGDPSKKEAKITYVKTGLDGKVLAEMDFELLPATAEIKYNITVADTSEKDYEGQEYYYYGTNNTGGALRTIRINRIVDYLPSVLSYDVAKNTTGIWEEKTAQELADSGLISTDADNNVKEAVSSGYTILVSKDNAFASLTKDNPVSLELFATGSITSTAKDLSFVNHTEIIDYTSTTQISDANGKVSTPGNYNPKKYGETNYSEADDDAIDFVITPPTGENKDYTTYIILGVSVMLILGLGIVIIKKKVINK